MPSASIPWTAVAKTEAMGRGSEQFVNEIHDLSLTNHIARKDSQSGFLKEGCRTQVVRASHEERIAVYVMRPSGREIERCGEVSSRDVGVSKITGGQPLGAKGWCARGKWHLEMMSNAAGRKRQFLVE